MRKNKKNINTTIKPFSHGNVTGAIFFDLRREKKGGYPVKYRVTYQRKVMYRDSGFALSEKDWLSIEHTKRQDLIQTRRMIFNGFLAIEEQVKDLIESIGFSFDALEKRLSRGNKVSVYSAFTGKIQKLKTNGQIGTAIVYECALTSLKNFNENQSLNFNEITPNWLKEYETWFINRKQEFKNSTKQGNSYSSLSMYIRCLRSIFNEAKQDGIITEAIYPFGRGKYEIQTGTGRKMAYNLEQIGKLMNIQLPEESEAQKMRDLWFFSYLTNGMNVKDLILLKWSSVKDKEIIYYREKTNRTSREKKPINAPILPQIEAILSKWGTSRLGDNFVFGYVNGNPTPEAIKKTTYNLTKQMNKHLRAIANQAGLPDISTYTARHSFATVLLRSGAGVEYISESLGHKDIKTTQNYLAGFEFETKLKLNSHLTNFG